MDQQSPTSHSGIPHETRLLEAYTAIEELPADALPPHWQAELTALTRRAYEHGTNIPTDGSGAQRIFETYDRIEKALEEIHQRKKAYHYSSPADRPVLQALRDSMLRLVQAQNALRDHSIQIEDRLNPDHPLNQPKG